MTIVIIRREHHSTLDGARPAKGDKFIERKIRYDSDGVPYIVFRKCKFAVREKRTNVWESITSGAWLG